MSNPEEANWICAIDDTALPEGHMAAAYPKGVNVLLARIGGDIYAVSGKCAHLGCPLFTGKLEGYTITCPCHDWRFDVRTASFSMRRSLAWQSFPQSPRPEEKSSCATVAGPTTPSNGGVVT